MSKERGLGILERKGRRERERERERIRRVREESSTGRKARVCTRVKGR